MVNTSDGSIPTKPERIIFQGTHTQKGFIEETRFAIDYVEADILKYDMIMRMMIVSTDLRAPDHITVLKNTIDSLKMVDAILEDSLKKMGGR